MKFLCLPLLIPTTMAKQTTPILFLKMNSNSSEEPRVSLAAWEERLPPPNATKMLTSRTWIVFAPLVRNYNFTSLGHITIMKASVLWRV